MAGDAEPLRVEGAADRDGFAIQYDLAGVGLVDARYDLDEGRFPRAVLAHEGMYLALAKFEADVVQGPYSREGLRYVLEFEYGIGHALTLLALNRGFQ
jgi:hypothetical protein